MSPLSDARSHLRKAKEFLEAAEVSIDLELFNAAASNAVTSGINSKDAVCLIFAGKSVKGDTHTDAVAELRAAGSSTKQAATTTKRLATVLGRLLTLKTRSRYQAADVARSEARKAVQWALILLDGATDITAR